MKDICEEIWLPEALFVYLRGKVAVAAEHKLKINKGYGKRS